MQVAWELMRRSDGAIYAVRLESGEPVLATVSLPFNIVRQVAESRLPLRDLCYTEAPPSSYLDDTTLAEEAEGDGVIWWGSYDLPHWGWPGA